MKLRFNFSSKQGGVIRSALVLMTFFGASGTLGWMLLMPSALRLEIESKTGFPFEAEVLASNPLGLSLTGYDMVVGNPGTFGGGEPMLEIESLEAQFSLPAWGRGEVWMHDLELKVSRLTLVVDESGRVNLDTFMNRIFINDETGEQRPFFAERVHLIVDELVMLDNSQIVPRNSAVRAMLDVEFYDIERPTQIFKPIREVAQSVGSISLD